MKKKIKEENRILSPEGPNKHLDLTPVACKCGWAGTRRQTIHSYNTVRNNKGEYDTKPVDRCPKCHEDI